MAVTIVLGFGQGNFEQDGFPVSLQIRAQGIVIKQEHNCARIPPAPSIPQLHSDLHERYNELGQTCSIEPVQGQTTHVSSDEVLEACKTAANSLRTALKSWFEDPKFESLRNLIWAEANAVVKTNRVGNTSVPVIIDVYTGNQDRDTLLRKLPWNLWDLFKKLEDAEPVLSAKVNCPISPLARPVRILAIFGSSETEGQQGRLRLEADLDALKQLEQFGAKIHPVIEPSRSDIHDLLWDKSWDILFFAGHSSSAQGHQNGYLQIGGGPPVALADLEADLEQAVNQGLKLAIFNSCDGLGIANYLASLDVPSTIIMREPVPDLVARKFLQFFLRAFSTGKPMYLAVREARKCLEYLQNDCPAASWLPIVCQNPSQPELIWPTTEITSAPNPENKLSAWKRIAVVGIAGLLLGAAIKSIVDQNQRPSSQITQPPPTTKSYLTSLGETILIKTDGAEKQKGSEAFAKGNYPEAIDYFKASLKQKPNDPEALIYLNNASANLNPNRPPLRIAVSVPIGSNLNVASEMLRGIAQAQNEINSDNKNVKKLEIKIANDSNNEEIARNIAAEFVNDDKILAVVGHNASNVSKAAAEIYQNKGLVMVTPAGFADILSGLGSYIFRTVPNPQPMAQSLADYVIKKTKKHNIAVCYDSEATDNNSFKESFVKSLTSLGGRDVPMECNLAKPTFNANTAIAEATRNQADGLMLSPHVDRISKAIELAKANNGKLPLFASPTLYTYQTLQEGQANVNKLVLAIPWQIKQNSQLAQDAHRWGGPVNWRTATSYDATIAIWTGLKKSQTRAGLQKVLREPSFSAPGSSGEVRFDEHGDRSLPAGWQPLLVQVEKKNPSQSGTGYDFVLK